MPPTPLLTREVDTQTSAKLSQGPDWTPITPLSPRHLLGRFPFGKQGPALVGLPGCLHAIPWDPDMAPSYPPGRCAGPKRCRSWTFAGQALKSGRADVACRHDQWLARAARRFNDEASVDTTLRNAENAIGKLMNVRQA